MKQEAKILLGIGAACLIILAGAVFFLSQSDTSSRSSSTKVDEKILLRNANHKITADSNKVTIVEFADYQCPACAAVNPTVKQLLREYKDKINYIYRHFPLPQHQNAVVAAKAAEAAGEQNKFWEMSDKLYENQKEWSEDKQAIVLFLLYAKDMGINVEEFKKSVESNKFQEAIEIDKNDALSLGVNSTPTFFINGQKFEGVPSYANFKKQIDDLLNF